MNEYKKIVQENLTERDLLEQLAEEAAELSQAALKYIRAAGMNGNVTPVRAEEAADAVFEELNDVLIVAEALGIFLGDHKMDNHKWQRWADRLTGKAVVADKPAATNVRQGHWEQLGGGEIFCSECELILANTPNYRYCPLCGAKMENDTIVALGA